MLCVFYHNKNKKHSLKKKEAVLRHHLGRTSFSLSLAHYTSIIHPKSDLVFVSNPVNYGSCAFILIGCFRITFTFVLTIKQFLGVGRLSDSCYIQMVGFVFP